MNAIRYIHATHSFTGIAFHPDPLGSKVAVVSQEDGAVWVGEFDWEALEFVPGGKVRSKNQFACACWQGASCCNA
jgi:hypothetical protein